MEQTVEEREEREEREEAEAEALADLKCRPSETIERVERMAATLRDAPPLKKGQLLDSLATDPPLGVRAGVDSDSEMRRVRRGENSMQSDEPKAGVDPQANERKAMTAEEERSARRARAINSGVSIME